MGSIIDGINLKLDPRVRPVTIVRDAGNVDTRMVADETGGDTGKRRVDPLTDHEFFAKFPSDSGLVTGDLVTVDGAYYLAMALEPKWFRLTIAFYRVTLYKCNSTVKIISFSAQDKVHNIEAKIGVPCLIAPEGSVGDDANYVIPKYSGSRASLRLFMKDITEMKATGDIILEDSNARRYRVSKQFNYWVTEGVIRASIIVET